MDKYEYTIKSDKIKKLVERKDYETAVKIADTIDWERVRNIKMLSTVSLAYEKVSRFEEAKDLLLMAYECAPVGRRFLYKLTELATKQGQYDEAEEYLKEFAATSPQDPSRLVLRYEISLAKGEPTERLITILEAYQKREFEERWSYELASLYYRVGKNEECVKLCDEIVLWFGVGTYVDKAMELKQRIAPLTPDQIEKRENKEKYLRRLEEVQKEFEEKYRVLEENSKKAIEEAAQAGKEQAAAAEPVIAEEAVIEAASETISVSEEIAATMAEEIDLAVAEEEASQQPLKVDVFAMEADLEAQRLQAEMEASLAREIETAALTAALNEAMLRETAATMETLGAVENDHSQESERTKVAVARGAAPEKTKEFVRQAKAIDTALQEAHGRVVTAAEVEARMVAQAPEEETVPEISVEVPAIEESAIEEPAVEIPVIEAEAPVIEEAVVEEPIVEEPIEEEPIEEEPIVEEPVVEEPIEEESTVEEPAVEEPTVEELTTKTIRDHYVLVASAQEDEGVKECVTYIRRMRELLGYPATQVAKIKGIKLATKDMAQTLRKLQGRDLVVVGIADLPDALLAQTVELMDKDNIESFIALIDTEEEIAKLQSRMAFFAGCRVIPGGLNVVVPAPVVEPVAAEPVVSEPEAAEPIHVEPTASAESSVPAEQAVQVTAPTMQPEVEGESTEDEQSTLARMVEEALRASVLSAMTEEAEEKEETIEETLEEEPAQEPSVEKHTTAAELNPNEFYECAVQYAHMMDAKVDEMGGLAIYAAAEEYQQERQPLTEELAQELVENAITKAERRTLKSLFSNRYDKEGFLILKEQHFKD